MRMSRAKYTRKVRVDLLSCNTLRLTNILFQKQFRLSEGYNWFDLINLKRLSGEHDNIEDLIRDVGYLLVLKKEGTSVGSTIFGYDGQSKRAYDIEYVCCGPDYKGYKNHAVVEVRYE